MVAAVARGGGARRRNAAVARGGGTRRRRAEAAEATATHGGGGDFGDALGASRRARRFVDACAMMDRRVLREKTAR